MTPRARNWRTTAGQGSRYLMTGSVASLIDVGGFAIGLHAGLPIVPAATLSFLVAAMINYLLTSRFVFRQRRTLRAGVLFIAVATLGLIVNVTLTTLIAAHTPLPPVAAKVVAIGMSFLFNFAMNTLIVFRPRDEGGAAR